MLMQSNILQLIDDILICMLRNVNKIDIVKFHLCTIKTSMIFFSNGIEKARKQKGIFRNNNSSEIPVMKVIMLIVIKVTVV